MRRKDHHHHDHDHHVKFMPGSELQYCGIVKGCDMIEYRCEYHGTIAIITRTVIKDWAKKWLKGVEREKQSMAAANVVITPWNRQLINSDVFVNNGNNNSSARKRKNKVAGMK